MTRERFDLACRVLSESPAGSSVLNSISAIAERVAALDDIDRAALRQAIDYILDEGTGKEVDA